jgi:predicted dehydrogenase
MAHHIDRRDMLKTTMALSAGIWVGSSTTPAHSAMANDKMNIAFIGIGGRGKANLDGIARTKQNIVALCDVDDKRAGKAYQRFPKAKKFYDFRRMLGSMEKQIDAVVVSTPDHTHFHPSMMSLEMGKHLYCEKPMAHSVWEIRQMTELAAKKKVATQLGVQRHTIGNVHRVVELLHSDAIGDVKEVYSWVGGSRGMPKVPTAPKDFPAVPDSMKWDLWVGPAKKREYSAAFAPYNWRFWWDYGTGETGNWGCHILDIPFWGLGLKYPTRVDASGPKIDVDRTPKSMATHFEFPASKNNGPVKLNWYHGTPPILKKLKIDGRGFNNLFIGEKGMLICGFGKRKLIGKQFNDFKAPEKSIPDSPGFYNEWITACNGGKPATCEFGYSGPLSETVLLGNTAYRAGGGFKWDAAQLKATGNSKADGYLQPTFRKGWVTSL